MESFFLGYTAHSHDKIDQINRIRFNSSVKKLTSLLENREQFCAGLHKHKMASRAIMDLDGMCIQVQWREIWCLASGEEKVYSAY